ncbi:MAG TPA: trypsin-like peptidase domain-containing protein [Bacteroidales bacterium]|nr:trypsin-like peptidase domain-containing protein [Bacteroidales bacterium]
MKKIGFVLLICLISCASSCYAQDKLPNLIKKIQPSIVSIITYDKNGDPLSSGSGFFINSDGNIITNCHVMEDAWSADIKTFEGKTYKVDKVLAHNYNSDIVMLSLKMPDNNKYIKITTNIPDIGSSVFVIGNPRGLEQTVSDGIVSAVRVDPDYGRVVQITAPISPGSSGSPVMNMKGEVIGVATYQFINGQNLNFAIPCQVIDNLNPVQNFSLAKWQEIKEYNSDEMLAVLLEEGEKYLIEEKYSDALKVFMAVDEQLPDMPEVSYLLGYCYQQMERIDEAFSSYKNALKLNEKYEYAYYGMAELYYYKKKYKKVLSYCDKSLYYNDEYADAYVLRAKAKDKLGDQIGAKSDETLANNIKAKNRLIDGGDLIRSSFVKVDNDHYFRLGLTLKMTFSKSGFKDKFKNYR